MARYTKIISTMRWIRTSRLSTKKSLSGVNRIDALRSNDAGEHGERRQHAPASLGSTDSSQVANLVFRQLWSEGLTKSVRPKTVTGLSCATFVFLGRAITASMPGGGRHRFAHTHSLTALTNSLTTHTHTSLSSATAFWEVCVCVVCVCLCVRECERPHRCPATRRCARAQGASYPQALQAANQWSRLGGDVWQVQGLLRTCNES